jgi:hypothetical protein
MLTVCSLNVHEKVGPKTVKGEYEKYLSMFAKAPMKGLPEKGQPEPAPTSVKEEYARALQYFEDFGISKVSKPNNNMTQLVSI